MSKREEYNSCMAPYMKGSKTKEQRKFDFCVGSKVCSGKASTTDEAEKICSAPKLPKWIAKEVDKPEEALSCEQLRQRVRNNIDAIALKIREGEAEEVRGAVAQIVSDFHACHSDEVDVLQVVNEMADSFHQLSKSFYFKGEAKDVINSLEVMKELA